MPFKTSGQLIHLRVHRSCMYAVHCSVAERQRSLCYGSMHGAEDSWCNMCSINTCIDPTVCCVRCAGEGEAQPARRGGRGPGAADRGGGVRGDRQEARARQGGHALPGTCACHLLTEGGCSMPEIVFRCWTLMQAVAPLTDSNLCASGWSSKCQQALSMHPAWAQSASLM